MKRETFEERMFRLYGPASWHCSACSARGDGFVSGALALKALRAHEAAHHPPLGEFAA